MTDGAVFGVETIDLDLPPLVGALSRRLHDAGVPVTPGTLGRLRSRAHARAADHAAAPVLDRARRVRVRPGTGRASSTRCSSRSSGVETLDEDFEPDDARTAGAPPDERPRSEHRTSLRDGTSADPRATVSASPPGDADDDDLAEVEVPLALASDEELLGRGASTRSSRTSSRSSTG